MATKSGREAGKMSLQLHLSGFEELKSNLSKLADNVVEGLYTAAEVAQARVINSARRIVPVKTGALQASIGAGRVIITDRYVKAEVVAGMKYATYVEKRKPYLGPALHEQQAGFFKSANAAIKAALKKSTK